MAGLSLSKKSCEAGLFLFAVYLHQADDDSEWGEIRFNFENGTAEIVKPADWDAVKSNAFAKRLVQEFPID